MSEQRWVRLSQWRSAFFSFPCRGEYCRIDEVGPGMSCEQPDEHHGHIELRDDDEDGEGDWFTFIPFRCRSQAGVRAVVEFDSSFSQEEQNGILGLAEVRALPQDLIDEEKVIVLSPDEMKALARIGVWYGRDKSK